jgi:putative transposase
LAIVANTLSLLLTSKFNIKIPMIVQKAFKYRFFPTDEQAAQLAETFGCASYVYNQALELRARVWRQEKKSVGYHETAGKLTEWKKEPEEAFLSEVSSVVSQQSLSGARKVTPTRNQRWR